MNARLAIVALVAIQVIANLVVHPAGEFPLNDDWAFAHSALWFATEHRVRLSSLSVMNLLPQTIVGGLAVALAGFSFELLRHVTQSVALLASLAAFAFFRVAAFSVRDAFVATLVTLAMPSWLVLANSYMTDLYGFVLLLGATAALVAGLSKPTSPLILAGALLAALGALQRQVVVVVPLAFLVASFFAWRGREPRRWIMAALPLVVTAVSLVLYQEYLRHGPGLPEAQAAIHSRVGTMLLAALRDDPPGLRVYVGRNLATVFGYLGWFAFGWFAWHAVPATPRGVRLAIGAMCALAAVAALAFGWLPPFQSDNTIDRAGIGPFTLRGAIGNSAFAAADRSAGLVWPLAGLATGAGFAALCVALLATARHVVARRRDADPVRVFVAAVLVAYLGPFVVTDYFDRYLLPMLPFVLVLWARAWPRAEPVAADSGPSSKPADGSPGQRRDRSLQPTGGWVRTRQAFALAWIGSTLALSAAATHDYFAWNRARWAAIRDAESRGATPDTIDGGYEYNGFYRYEAKDRGPTPGKSWWWVRDDVYVAAFAPLAGYEIARRFPVERWLSRTPAEVLLLRRSGS